jgi:putative PEP-CTERM system TPR-repeat lipoprotein
MSRNAKLKRTAAIVSAVLALGAGLAACSRDQSTATLLAEAKDYQQKGDKKAALIQLKNAVAKSPEDAEARIQLGALYLDMGDILSADKEIRKAKSLGMSPARTLPLLAKTLQAQGKFKELLDEITLDGAKNSAPLLTLRGEAYLATGDAAKARESFDQALALAPDSGEAMVGLARHALMQKDVAGAERHIADAIAKDAKNPEVWIFSAAMLRSQNKLPEALAAYDKALALAPGHRSAHIDRAHLEIGLGKFDAAKADIDAAAKIAPGNLNVTYTQALLDFTQGKHAAAQESLQKVLRAAPEHMPSILLAGAVELQLGATGQAEQHLRKYLGAFPDNLYARKMLAQALLKNAQPDDAVAALAPALKEPTQDAQLLALAGESYMQARNYGKATDYFEKASALAPKAAVLHTSLGLSRIGAGQQEKGLSDLETAAALDPKSVRAGVALVQTELGLKHYDKALAAVQTLEKEQPDSPQVQNLKGGVYLVKGDRAAARAAFEKAVALQPTYFAAVSNLAQLDMQDKQPDAAKKRFEAVLAKDPKNFGAMAALAEIAAAQNRPEEATTWLEKASSASPDAIAPVLKLGAHYLRIKQPQKALTLARKHQTEHPTNADLLDLLGQSQLATGDNGGALDTYSKLVNVMPKSALAQMRLATVQVQMKNDSAAADSLKRAVDLQPDFMPARAAQIELAVRQGRVDDALAGARKLQKDSPASAAGYVIEGDVLLSQGKAAAALPAYEKAQQIAKTPQMTVKLAEVMKRAGRANAVQPLLAGWLKQHPDEPVVALYAAETHMSGKQYKPAIALLEGVLKRSPGNPVALNNLAWSYQQVNDPRALATAEQALKVTADSPAVMDTLGWMLVEQGNTARGVPLLQKAVALAPDASEIRYHLAVGLNQAGDKAGARKELDKLLAQNKPFAQLEEARTLLKML